MGGKSLQWLQHEDWKILTHTHGYWSMAHRCCICVEHFSNSSPWNCGCRFLYEVALEVGYRSIFSSYSRYVPDLKVLLLLLLFVIPFKIFQRNLIYLLFISYSSFFYHILSWVVSKIHIDCLFGVFISCNMSCVSVMYSFPLVFIAGNFVPRAVDGMRGVVRRVVFAFSSRRSFLYINGHLEVRDEFNWMSSVLFTHGESSKMKFHSVDSF